MEKLHLLDDKLSLLLKKYRELQKDKDRLSRQVGKQSSEIALLKTKIKELEMRAAMDGIGGHLSGEQKTDLRQQLDEIFKNIDQILSTLPE